MVDGAVLLLADVTVLRFKRLPEVKVGVDRVLLELGGREDVRAGEYRLAAQGAYSGAVESLLLLSGLFRLSLSNGGSHQPATRLCVRGIHVTRCLEQTTLILGRHLRQEPAIGNDRVEQLSGRADS